MRVNAIKLPFKIKRSVLAFGSQAKNTLCFINNTGVYISRVHADLNNPRDFIDFEKDARFFLKKNPQAIAYDYHLGYSSSSFAINLAQAAGKALPVFHHQAHICSCMAENGLKNQKVIGVAFDGTGLGQDNALWGAEFLICDYSNFFRAAHLKEIPLAGAEKAIFEPWRLAAFWLYQAFGNDFKKLRISWLSRLDLNKWEVIRQAAEKGINSPYASSAGRLFDAAASLILGKMYAEYEAQLPMELEKIASQGHQVTKSPGKTSMYEFKIKKEKEGYVIDPAGFFKGIVRDLKARKPKEEIAYKFHLSVAKMVEGMCIILSKKNKIKKIVLSGGVFQNKLLLEMSKDLLRKSGLEVFSHQKLLASDTSLSLGQAVIASFNRG